MTEKTSPAIPIKIYPKFLWFLILSFAMIIAISNWFDARLISFRGGSLAPGTWIFSLSFLISGMITEVYGYKQARKTIWATLLFNILFLIYGQVLIHLPSPASAINNPAFDKLLSMNIFIILGSFASYIISEPINSYIVAKLKVKLRGQYLGLRFALSTIIAIGIDSILFSFIAYFNVLNIKEILSLIGMLWLIKTSVAAVGLPFSIRYAKKLKEIEQLDIYDKTTNFNILSLDANYSSNDNGFGHIINIAEHVK